MDYIRRLFLFFCCASALFAFNACSDDDDQTETTVSGSCAVTSVVLGSIPYYVHTTASDGSDSIYETVLTGSNYPLSIDQTNNRIYLHDSLPAGADISRVTFASFNYQGSSAVIRSLEMAEDTVFNISDSTDCRLPRLITVYATDGTTRSYTLELMVHKQTGTEMNWSRVAENADVAALSEQKLLFKDGSLYLYGVSEEQQVLLLSADQGATWTQTLLGTDLLIRSVTQHDGTFYAIDAENNVVSSTDGITWTACGTQTLSLLVAGTHQLYGISESALWSSDDAQTWQQDEMDDDASLPVDEWCGVALPSRTNTGYEDVLLTGLTADGTPSLWRRTVDASGLYTFPWNSIDPATDSGAYPLLTNTSLLLYDDAPLLVGLDGTAAMLYFSRDRGRTWLTGDIDAPDTGEAQSASAVVDEDNNIFITLGGCGEVWRGKLARLAWKPVQNAFYYAPRR